MSMNLLVEKIVRMIQKLSLMEIILQVKIRMVLILTH